MIVYKCDGETFNGNKKCVSEYESGNNDDIPNWLTITGQIINDLPDSRLKVGNGTRHFCSKSCLDFYLFKNEKSIFTFNHNVIIFPNEKGWDRMVEITMKVYELNRIEAKSCIELKKTEDGGYKDHLWEIIKDFNSMFYHGQSFFENTYIDFCN